MTEVIDAPGNALHVWREIDTGSPGLQAWVRIPCGWGDEEIRPQAMQISNGIDIEFRPYVTIHGQEQVSRGPNKGKWVDGRGDFHTRDAYLEFLAAVVNAGQRAGWL